MREKQPDKRLCALLDALAHEVRLRIIMTLSRSGPLNYTSLMERVLGRRDRSGMFEYHLRKLVNAGLVEKDTLTGNYRLTKAAKSIGELLEALREAERAGRGIRVHRRGRGLEDFRREKIIESLCREAGTPRKIAEAVADKVRQRLQEMRLRRITGAIIRELACVALLEQGYEEYHDKYTRLGMPAYDVKLALETEERPEALAGARVIAEYTLAHGLPEEVSEAHMEGIIRVNRIEHWLLRPDTLHHDTCALVSRGLADSDPMTPLLGRAENLNDAIHVLLQAASIAKEHLGAGQVFDHLNLALAPFTHDTDDRTLRRQLRALIEMMAALSSDRYIVLGLDLGIPDHLKELKLGEHETADLLEEAERVAKTLLELWKARPKPYLRPLLLVKVYERVREDVLRLLAEAALSSGNLVFANMMTGWQRPEASYDAEGLRLAASRDADEGLRSTMRTGIIGTVSINVPQLFEDGDIDEGMLERAIALSLKALRVKREALARRIRDGGLRVLTRMLRDEYYFVLEHAQGVINLVGAYRSAMRGSRESFQRSRKARESLLSMLRVANRVLADVAESDERVAISLTGIDDDYIELASEEDGYYEVDPAEFIKFDKALEIASEVQPLSPGGHLLNFVLDEPPPKLETFERVLREELRKARVGLLTFSRDFTYCNYCGRVFGGHRWCCVYCSFSGQYLVHYSKPCLRYEVADKWPRAKVQRHRNRYKHILR